MQFSRINLLMTDHFLSGEGRDNSTQNARFLICLYHSIARNNCATMFFLQFMLYSPSFVDSQKNEIPEAAPELCHLKSKQFSPDILKFRTKHEDNPFSLNCSMVPHSFLFIFHPGSRGVGSNDFWKSSYKEKTPDFFKKFFQSCSARTWFTPMHDAFVALSVANDLLDQVFVCQVPVHCVD